jgi:hypothetical protein
VLVDLGYDHDKYRRELRQRRITPEIARHQTEHGSKLGRAHWSSSAPSPGGITTSGYSSAMTAAMRSHSAPAAESPEADAAAAEHDEGS